jgi:hypothetical protein
MDRAWAICKIIMVMTAVIATALSTTVSIRLANYDELNDPDRTHFITRTDANLQSGEIYEKEFIPAHREQRSRTEMQSRFGYGINPATGQFSYHHGFFPTRVIYYMDIPDTFALRIVMVDTERLVRFTNEIIVSEYAFSGYEVGDVYDGR